MNEFVLDDSYWINFYCLATLALSSLVWLRLTCSLKGSDDKVQQTIKRLDKVRTRVE